jgi:hypothetical protein
MLLPSLTLFTLTEFGVLLALYSLLFTMCIATLSKSSTHRIRTQKQKVHYLVT